MLRFQAQFKVLVLTNKVLNSMGPSYLKNHISLYDPAPMLRSSGEAFLSVPTPSQAHLVETWEKAFSVPAPKLSHSLPQEASLAPSLLSFCLSLQAGFPLATDFLGSNKQDGLYFVTSESVFFVMPLPNIFNIMLLIH